VTCAEILKGKEVRELVFTEPRTTCADTLRKMRELDASQVPVIEKGGVVGTVYEDTLVELALGGKDLKNVIVREIMSEPLPIVAAEAGLDEITRYIPGKVPALLVRRGSSGYDIITKYDLVRTVGEAAESGRHGTA
jgi:cystathionine beta-synthase